MRTLTGERGGSRRGVAPGGALAGQALVVVLLLVFLGVIFIPLGSHLLRQESRESAKGFRDDLARNIAKEALDKVDWAYFHDKTFAKRALAGEFPNGYDGTTVHTEIAGGEYKVRLSTAPGDASLPVFYSLLTVEVVARLTETHHQAGIQAVYKVPVINSPSYRSINIGANNHHVEDFPIHWGPVVGVDFWAPAGFNRSDGFVFPRKYYSGDIYINSTQVFDNGTDVFANFSGLDSSFQSAPDTNYYIARASNSVVPLNSGGGKITYILQGVTSQIAADAFPVGSGYFPPPAKKGGIAPGGIAFGPNYSFVSSTAVIFMDTMPAKDYSGAPVFLYALLSPGAYLDVEALFVRGVLVVGGPGGGAPNDVVIPKNADREYQNPLAVSTWTAGIPSMASVHSSPGRCCFPVPDVNARGFIHAEYVCAAQPGGAIIGVISTEVLALGTYMHGQDCVGLIYPQAYGFRLYFNEELASKANLRKTDQDRFSKEWKALPW